MDYDAMKLLISQSVVVPVPACCAPDTFELPLQVSRMQPCIFNFSGATLYCFRVRM